LTARPTVRLVPAGPSGSLSSVDVKSLHAKIGELTLENDFFRGRRSPMAIAERKRYRPCATTFRSPAGRIRDHQPSAALPTYPAAGVDTDLAIMRHPRSLHLEFPLRRSRMPARPAWLPRCARSSVVIEDAECRLMGDRSALSPSAAPPTGAGPQDLSLSAAAAWITRRNLCGRWTSPTSRWPLGFRLSGPYARRFSRRVLSWSAGHQPWKRAF